MSTKPTTHSSAGMIRAGACALAVALALGGCASGKWGFPYRAGVQQGNWITQEQVALLQPGMTREQVRFALGSPTLTSALHADRWDYPYYYKPGYGAPSERQFTVFFKNDLLSSWAGDSQPELQPFQVVEQDARKSVENQARSAREAARERDDLPRGQISPRISVGTERAPVSDAPTPPTTGN